MKQEIKRQRRVSEAFSIVQRQATLDDDSDDDAENGTSNSRSKKARAEAVQSARAAEQREKDKERERARAAAAGRRQERAGRRRVDGESRTASDGVIEPANPVLQTKIQATTRPHAPLLHHPPSPRVHHNPHLCHQKKCRTRKAQAGSA